MGYTPLEVGYRKSAEAVATYDFFDSILGAAFIKFYMATGSSGATTQFILTIDGSHVSDSLKMRQTGTFDLDFDILVDIPFTVAAREVVFNWLEGTGAGTIQWTIYHVAVGGSETSLGTVTGNTNDVEAKKSSRVIITSKRFKKGEKLRINAIGTNSALIAWFDPSGKKTVTDAEARTVNSTASVLIPIVVPR